MSTPESWLDSNAVEVDGKDPDAAAATASSVLMSRSLEGEVGTCMSSELLVLYALFDKSFRIFLLCQLLQVYCCSPFRSQTSAMQRSTRKLTLEAWWVTTDFACKRSLLANAQSTSIQLSDNLPNTLICCHTGRL